MKVIIFVKGYYIFIIARLVKTDIVLYHTLDILWLLFNATPTILWRSPLEDLRSEDGGKKSGKCHHPCDFSLIFCILYKITCKL